MIKRLMFEDVLSKLPLFAGLPPRALEAIESAGRILSLSANHTLYYKGDLANSFYVVLKGGIRLVDYTAEGRTIHIKLYGAGDVLGLLAISGAYPYPHAAEAIEATQIFAIRGEDIRYLAITYPEIGLAVIDGLVAHIHEAHHRIAKQFAERVEQRLATALLHYAQKFGTKIDDGVSLDIAISQQSLADFVGTTLESVNRTLSQWGKNGWVRVSRGHIDLLNLEILSKISNGEPVRLG
ncbi:MAG: Crp/Fnr family transcriptional regulator [Anaerolineae bacterium]|nr:Crp/Fnr family transcriptional regulator [Anaerolineae bacterium]